MNRQTIQNALIALTLCTSAFAQTAEVHEDQEGTMVMETSKPHLQPQMMTLQTAQVLESYGLGFSGSGNIHQTLFNSDKHPLRGSVILGLGDALELGYGMMEYRTTTQDNNRIMKGHIKLQLNNPDNIYVPRVAVAYGQNLQDGFVDGQGQSYTLNRMQGEALASMAYGTDKSNVTFHPGAQLIQDEITEIGAVKLKGKRSFYYNPQLAISWQSKEKLVYMFETRYHRILKDSSLQVTDKLHYEGAVDANFGARFFLRNWLFMDAGIKTIYKTEQDSFDSEIHANFTGVIPLKSVFTRASNLRK